MKEKRKNIISRVGAMVAAVLLVALCALPAFAEEGVNNDSVVGSFEETYEVAPNSALGAILNSGSFDITKTPYVSVFTTPSVGSRLGLVNAATIGFHTIIDKGWFAMTEKTENGTTYLYDECTLQTSFYTSSPNRYFYFDFYQSGEIVATRVCRIRIKQDQTTGEVLSCEIEGDISGDASNYEFAFVCGMANYNVLPYGYSRGLLVSSIDTNFYDFSKVYDYAFEVGDERGYLRGETFGYNNGYADGVRDGEEVGYEDGYQIGKNEGYDDGMSQSSLIDGVTAIFRAPMELINSILNFEFLGINMAVAVRVLISMAILGVVITVIWKAVK